MYRGSVFIQSRNLVENGGLIVAKARHVELAGGTGVVSFHVHLFCACAHTQHTYSAYNTRTHAHTHTHTHACIHIHTHTHTHTCVHTHTHTHYSVLIPHTLLYKLLHVCVANKIDTH